MKNPPYFEGMTMEPPGIRPITGARALAMLGDSITTDHISPAGNIPASSPAGQMARRARRARRRTSTRTARGAATTK